MAKEFTLSQTMAASPRAVFSVLSDLDQAQKWMPAIQKIHKLSQGPLAKGSKWIETRTDPRGKVFVSTLQVTALEPDTEMGLNVDHKMLGMDIQFRLTPEGAGTKVDYRATVNPKGFAKLFSGKIVKMMQES